MLLNVVTIIRFFFMKNTLFLDLSSRNKNLGNQLKNLDGNLSFFIRNTFHRQFFLRLFNEPSSSLCHHDETRPLYRVNRS